MPTDLVAVRELPKPSLYVDSSYYARLDTWNHGWRSVESMGSDPDPETLAVIRREAWLLDCQRYEDWLALYSDDCAYWVTQRRDGRDPRDGVALIFDDRRRMLDRITRLGTGKAYSQLPPTRSSRVLGLPEVVAELEGVALVRCPFVTLTVRNGKSRSFGGWFGYALRRDPAGIRMICKQTNLVDCDEPLPDTSFIL